MKTSNSDSLCDSSNREKNVIINLSEAIESLPEVYDSRQASLQRVTESVPKIDLSLSNENKINSKNNINFSTMNEIETETKYKRKTLHCNNCGKKGHYYNKCTDPITSVGTICFKVDDIDNLELIFKDLISFDKKTLMRLKHTSGLDIGNKIDDFGKLHLFNKYLESIKFLMVRRKYTLGFIEFMKARWDATNKSQLINIFEKIGKKEKSMIRANISESKWINIFETFWIKDGKINFDKKKDEFGRKFLELRDLEEWNLEYYCVNIGTGSNKPDWGYCKGRRDGSETNPEVAKRESKEESGNDVILLENLEPLKEDIKKGNNDILRNIYYIGLLDNKAIAEYKPELYDAHKSEIGDIGFFKYMDALSLINPEHVEKKNILTQAYMFIAGRLMKYENMQKKQILTPTPNVS